MKKYLTILLIISTKCFSQSESDRQIIDSILEVSNLPVVVCKQSQGYSILEETISKGSVYNRHFHEKKIDLTEKEMLFIKNEIKRNKNFIFSQEMFPNELLISNDTLKSYSSYKAKMWRKEYEDIFAAKDSVKMMQFRREKPYADILTFVHFFSKPIYFRNDTLCIIYYANLCSFHNGMGGCYEIVILKKDNGVWKKFIKIPRGCY